MRTGSHRFIRRAPGQWGRVFFFFSNRLGCGPSLLLSAVVTLVLLFLFGVID